MDRKPTGYEAYPFKTLIFFLIYTQNYSITVLYNTMTQLYCVSVSQ